MAYTNDTKALQGIRMGGKLVWVKPGETVGQEAPAKSGPEPTKDDPYANVSDDTLRDEIEDKTGKRPHHNTKRDKLIEQHKAL